MPATYHLRTAAMIQEQISAREESRTYSRVEVGKILAYFAKASQHNIEARHLHSDLSSKSRGNIGLLSRWRLCRSDR
jgi:hypothetical protein